MTDAPPLLARVQMPEKGVFAVRCPNSGFTKGHAVVVNLGYGPDLGMVLGLENYDPTVHGPSVPGYQLVRAKTDDDAAAEEANARRCETWKEEFLVLAREKADDIRILHMRLSLGRQRLFVWYATSVKRCDLTSLARDFGQRRSVQVFARQLGPRDEVCLVGGLGPCGRPCCCATWQTRYPTGLTPDRIKDCASAQVNGICGRYKCCLAFESW